MKLLKQPQQLWRGFAVGIVLSLGVAGCIMLGSHITDAQGMEEPQPAATTNQSATVTSRAPFVDPVSDTTLNTSATPTPVSPPTTTQQSEFGQPPEGNYVALGDSVAAGLGLPQANNASAIDKQCGRSPQAYPYQVATALGKQVSLVACSGATAGDLFTKQSADGPNITAQLDQAYANNKPGLLTITAGANDIQWSTFVQKCYVSTCGTTFDNAVIKTSLAALEAKLYYAFYNIKVRTASETPPRVIITGYYNPVSSQCTAVSQGKLTTDEVNWVTANVNSLNNTIQSVARKFNFVRYAAVDFSGHDLCSTDPWIQNQTDPAPIHPTAAGQNAIAQSVVTASRQNQ